MKLESNDTAVTYVDDTEEDATCTLEEYQEQVNEIKTELVTLKTMLLASNISTDDSLMQDQAQMEKVVFDQLLKIKTPLCANCNFHQGHCGLHNQATQAGIELFMGTY